MAKLELNNKGSYSFLDVSGETYREYIWESGAITKIDKPQWLAVSESGHRLLDGSGVCHFIPFGWIHLYWGL